MNSMVWRAVVGDNTEKVLACPVWKLTRWTGGAKTGDDSGRRGEEGVVTILRYFALIRRRRVYDTAILRFSAGTWSWPCF